MTSRWNIGFIPAAASLLLAACSAPAKPVAAPEIRKQDSPKLVSAKPRAGVSTIALEEFFQLHESGKAFIIDARPSFVYQFGHVPGAINMPKSRCVAEIGKLESEFRSITAAGRKIIVYCTGPNCPDARTVADHLAMSGIAASVFAGGWEAWHEAGMPVE
jgi:rhodanese-related sulfurtransferase